MFIIALDEFTFAVAYDSRYLTVLDTLEQCTQLEQRPAKVIMSVDEQKDDTDDLLDVHIAS